MALRDARRCTAHSKRTREPCRQPAVTGRTVCIFHGGRSPRGIAAANWKHGRYSRALPADMMDAFERARTDPELIALRDELALVDARLVALVGDLDRSGCVAETEKWARVYEAIALRRRLADTERKRLEAMQATVTVDRVMALAAAIGASVKRHVKDRATRLAIANDLEALLQGNPETARVAG